MPSSYSASDIEVLSGLDPVRRRPGMYTDTTRPNHLAHEVIDNSVDEALAGHCDLIEVVLFKDGSLQVTDNGRGMPVDIHPKEKVSGVELILTRLHAGGKFNDSNYKFSGGLHGVGVSVVNALSRQLDCWVRRGGKEYNIGFRSGKVYSKLEETGTVGQKNTGTTVRFWPESAFFDNDRFAPADLRHTLKAKAVLCPGLRVRFENEATGEKDEWFYTGALTEYLVEQVGKTECLPREPLSGKHGSERDAVEWALIWAPNLAAFIAESYVNLIPTSGGGTHVNGLRSGVAAAVREFAEFRNLLPRGVKLSPEDIWNGVSFVLSIRMKDPQFAGQTKERLGSREAAALVEGLRPRQHGAVAEPASGCRRAHRAICHRECAGTHEGGAEGHAQARGGRSRAAGQTGRLQLAGSGPLRTVPGRGRLRRWLGAPGARSPHPGSDAPCAARS